jgi:hypothetical protein
MLVESLIAVLTAGSSLLTSAGLLATYRHRGQQRRQQDDQDAGGVSLLSALTPEDKSWLRAHGWNGIVRITRRRP